MPVYAYKALDRQGRSATGTLPADTKSGAMDQLEQRGLSPISVNEQGGGGSAAAAPAGVGGRIGRLFAGAPGAGPSSGASSYGAALAPAALVPARTKVPKKSLESFTREMANLLAAGLSLSRSLSLLRREASNPVAKRVWSAIHDDVVGGTSLGDALAKWPRVFSTVYVAMVRAGEAGGFLPVVLQQIADFRTREADLRGKVKASMIYPIALAVVATLVLTFLLTFFIPKFSVIFKDLGGELPLLTRIIVSVSEFLTTYGLFVLIGLVVGAFLLHRALKTESGRRRFELILLKTPAFGPVMARFSLVRFGRMLGTLVGAGVPLVASLRVAREALGNQTLADTVTQAIDQVQRGTALSKSLSGNPLLFPPSVIEIIAVAEETARLDKELVRLSITYEADLERQLRMLVALVEPIMLVVMAGLIGTIVIGMLLPVFMLQNLVK